MFTKLFQLKCFSVCFEKIVNRNNGCRNNDIRGIRVRDLGACCPEKSLTKLCNLVLFDILIRYDKDKIR